TPATDIYSLGVIAYQLLLGHAPFSASDDLALVEMHLNATPPAPASFRPDLPRALGALFVQMLAKHPADRPTLPDIIAALHAGRPPPPRVDPGRARPGDRRGVAQRVPLACYVVIAMKKLTTFLAVATLALALGACKKKRDTEQKDDTTARPAEETKLAPKPDD